MIAQAPSLQLPPLQLGTTLLQVPLEFPGRRHAEGALEVGACFWKAYHSHSQQKDAKWSPCYDAEQETMVKYGKVWKTILINSVEEVHFVMFCSPRQDVWVSNPVPVGWVDRLRQGGSVSVLLAYRQRIGQKL